MRSGALELSDGFEVIDGGILAQTSLSGATPLAVSATAKGYSGTLINMTVPSNAVDGFLERDFVFLEVLFL